MRFWHYLDKYFEPVLIVSAIGVMTTLLCVQIVLRFFDVSLIWAEELARYLFVWAMYLSISYCIKEHRHIRIRALLDLLPEKIAEGFLIVADLCFFGFSVLVLYYGFHLIEKSLALGQIAPALEISVAWLYASVVVGALLNALRLCVSIKERVIKIGSTQSKELGL